MDIYHSPESVPEVGSAVFNIIVRRLAFWAALTFAFVFLLSLTSNLWVGRGYESEVAMDCIALSVTLLLLIACMFLDKQVGVNPTLYFLRRLGSCVPLLYVVAPLFGLGLYSLLHVSNASDSDRVGALGVVNFATGVTLINFLHDYLSDRCDQIVLAPAPPHIWHEYKRSVMAGVSTSMRRGVSAVGVYMGMRGSLALLSSGHEHLVALGGVLLSPAVRLVEETSGTSNEGAAWLLRSAALVQHWFLWPLTELLETILHWLLWPLHAFMTPHIGSAVFVTFFSALLVSILLRLGTHLLDVCLLYPLNFVKLQTMQVDTSATTAAALRWKISHILIGLVTSVALSYISEGDGGYMKQLIGGWLVSSLTVPVLVALSETLRMALAGYVALMLVLIIVPLVRQQLVDVIFGMGGSSAVKMVSVKSRFQYLIAAAQDTRITQTLAEQAKDDLKRQGQGSVVGAQQRHLAESLRAGQEALLSRLSGDLVSDPFAVPCVHVFYGGSTAAFSSLTRALAWQDLSRHLRSADADGQSELLCEHWHELGTMACSMVNALALQLEVHVTHSIVETLMPARRDFEAALTGPLVEWIPLVRRLGISSSVSFTGADGTRLHGTICRDRGCGVYDIDCGRRGTAREVCEDALTPMVDPAVRSVPGATSSSSGGRGAGGPVESRQARLLQLWLVVREGQRKRRKTTMGRTLAFLRGKKPEPLGSFGRRALGIDLSADPLPAVVVQCGVHAVETLVNLLVKGSEEICAIQVKAFLPAALRALLSLESALRAYDAIVEVCRPMSGEHSSALLWDKAHTWRGAMSISLDEGLHRLVTTFRMSVGKTTLEGDDWLAPSLVRRLSDINANAR